MRTTPWPLLGLLLAGCASPGTDVEAARPIVTVTATETVTETVTATPTVPRRPDGGAPGLGAHSPSPAPPPMIGLRVHTDGCGLIRADVDTSLYHNLGWSIHDEDGFEVLQRNATGETHYRYYRPGGYTARLTAWDGEKYAPVSDEVTIRC